MDKNVTSMADAIDCRLSLATIAGIYTPLVLILGAGLLLF